MISKKEFEGKKILITGGTGFIGGRLVEVLKSYFNADVRVLVSNYANISRIARFSIDVMKGDICNSEDVNRAVNGCDYVFHCAYGNKGSNDDKRRVNVDGTRNILSACLEYKVKRLVYLSTIMVYGQTSNGDIDENAPKKSSGGTYSDTKLEAEQLVLQYFKEYGLSVAILQPTAVYGPYSPVWGINILTQLKSGKVILINDGDGYCNAVYIDDLVNAMLLAAIKEEANGESFIISNENIIPWKTFYGYYENMLGYKSTVAMSEAEADSYEAKLQTKKSLMKIIREDKEFRSRLLETPLLGNLAKTATKLIPNKALATIKKINQNGKQPTKPFLNGTKVNNRPIHPLSHAQIQFYSTKSHFRVDKAKQMLGYKPIYSFDAGMKLTEQWAEAANLLEKREKIVELR